MNTDTFTAQNLANAQSLNEEDIPVPSSRRYLFIFTILWLLTTAFNLIVWHYAAANGYSGWVAGGSIAFTYLAVVAIPGLVATAHYIRPLYGWLAVCPAVIGAAFYLGSTLDAGRTIGWW